MEKGIGWGGGDGEFGVPMPVCLGFGNTKMGWVGVACPIKLMQPAKTLRPSIPSPSSRQRSKFPLLQEPPSSSIKLQQYQVKPKNTN
ncbi:hypothetical protein L6452_14456 [Arctium lappa]|uniref:Uncharacterized protein n=1 Tax=Arctium lappa TaxID=4217 RepID=A0ACB9CL32_ARCLA|nr:hypothetical protein L6452_14456 [Arctium lappa]